MDDLYEMALAENGRDELFVAASPIHDNGLFTNSYIPSNTIICRRLGLRAPLSLRDKRAIVGIDGVDPATPEDVVFKQINHSCLPNAWLNDTGCLVSVETLLEGSEITIDYAPLLQGSDWQTRCYCGEPECRKIIKAG